MISLNQIDATKGHHHMNYGNSYCRIIFAIPVSVTNADSPLCGLYNVYRLLPTHEPTDESLLLVCYKHPYTQTLFMLSNGTKKWNVDPFSDQDQNRQIDLESVPHIWWSVYGDLVGFYPTVDEIWRYIKADC